ncbi:MAG: phage integrase N-terminal SAM-like domain-containing protein [Bacillota bacterium]
MSKLIQTMKVDLELKDYSSKTIEVYLRYSKQFLNHYQKPIEQLHTDDSKNKYERPEGYLEIIL